jgi:hypothetical protein
MEATEPPVHETRSSASARVRRRCGEVRGGLVASGRFRRGGVRPAPRERLLPCSSCTAAAGSARSTARSRMSSRAPAARRSTSITSRRPHHLRVVTGYCEGGGDARNVWATWHREVIDGAAALRRTSGIDPHRRARASTVRPDGHLLVLRRRPRAGAGAAPPADDGPLGGDHGRRARIRRDRAPSCPPGSSRADRAAHLAARAAQLAGRARRARPWLDDAVPAPLPRRIGHGASATRRRRRSARRWLGRL